MDRLPHGIILDVTPGSAVFETDVLERLGHPVLVCHGPMHDVCPLLEDEASCEMVDSAHGVVFSLDLDRSDHRAILARYREILAEERPIRVVVMPGQEADYADLLAGCQVWTHQPYAGDLDGFTSKVEADRFEG
jgi:hypothetical protein